MRLKYLFFIFLIILLANAISINADESTSYTVDSNEGVVMGGAESTSYTFGFEVPLGQTTSSGSSSNTYYFGEFEGEVEIESDDPSPSSGGGSGGGVPRITSEVNFNVVPKILKYFLKIGNEKSKDITITNQGIETITINLIELSGFIGVESKSITLKSGESKKLFILVSAMNEKEGIYTSKIILSSGDVQSEVILLIEIEKVQSDIDLLVDVQEEYKIIVNEDSILSNLVFYDLSGEKNINLTLEYFIQDLQGNVLVTENEIRIVSSGSSFSKNIELIDKLKSGDYIFSVKASVGDKSVFSGSLFKVVDSEKEKQVILGGNIEDYTLILKFGFFIFLLVLIIILLETEKINLMINLCEFNVKHKDFYHAKINYNKLVKMFNKHVFKKGKKELVNKEIQELHKHIINMEEEHKSLYF